MYSSLYANPKGLAPITPTLQLLQASRVSFKLTPSLSKPHANTRVGFLFDGGGVLALGVGAPCLGGGHPSLTPTLI